MNKCIVLIVMLCYFSIQNVVGQDYFVLAGFGYGTAHGPIEKYEGTSLNIGVGKYVGNFFISASYNHFTGDVNYGTLYSRDTPNVGVVDKYRDNYPLLAYSKGRLEEIEAGIYQFDPSFSFYIARQARLNLGFKVLNFKIAKSNFSIEPSIGITYTNISENFIYGVKKITIEDDFRSENFIEINHLIFAYLKYSDFGYGFNLPLKYKKSNNLDIFFDCNFHSTFRDLYTVQFTVGLVKKIDF